MPALLIEHTLRVSLVAASAGLILALFKVRSASTRHAVWTGVLLSMLALPAWTTWGPKATVRLLSPIPSSTTSEASLSTMAAPSSPASPPTSTATQAVPSQPRQWWPFFVGVYSIGLVVLLFRLAIGTVRAQRLLRGARHDGAMRISTDCVAPVTVGWFRPMIIVPANWREWPTTQQIAVLAHEREHVRRRDPLIQWIALLNRAVFWFHPLSWWLERRLSALAEEACDDAVLEQGVNESDYCESLLHFARSVANRRAHRNAWGMTMPGARLTQRVARIQSANRPVPIAGARRAFVLAACLFTAVMFMTGSIGRAAAFDVASIRPSRIARAGGEGSRRERVAVAPNGVTLTNVSLVFCIQWAFKVKFYQVSGPRWAIDERFDIAAKTSDSVASNELRGMLQALLADRFRLQTHRESKPQPVYELIAKNTSKLQPSKSGEAARLNVIDGSFVFEHVTMAELAERLADLSAIDRPVLDATGLDGTYDITLTSAARAMLDDPGSIFTAIENVGLKLEPRKRPVEVIVIDRAERPSEN